MSKLIGYSFASCIMTALMFSPASAQKAPGTYDACSVDNPPANCSNNMHVQIVAALAAPTGLPVDNPNPECDNNKSQELIEKALDALEKSPNLSALEMTSGNLFDVFAAPASQAILKNTGGAVHDFVLRNGAKKSTATCAPVAAYIPRSAKIVGYRLFVHDIDAAPPQHWGGCAPGIDCSIGYSKFYAPPEEVDSGAGGRAVVATFANWSHDRRRAGHMYVFYTLPDGKKPIPMI